MLSNLSQPSAVQVLVFQRCVRIHRRCCSAAVMPEAPCFVPAAVKGCPVQDKIMPVYCYSVTRSLCHLLCFLEGYRPLDHLQLDFSLFNRQAVLDADAHALLACIWTSLTDLLEAHGQLRWAKCHSRVACQLVLHTVASHRSTFD